MVQLKMRLNDKALPWSPCDYAL